MHMGGMLHRNTETFLTHIFGQGLEDDKYVVERFKSGADGQISPCDGEPSNGSRHKLRRKIVSRKTAREMRPERDEIIVCTAVNMKDSGAQFWGAWATGLFAASHRR